MGGSADGWVGLPCSDLTPLPSPSPAPPSGVVGPQKDISGARSHFEALAEIHIIALASFVILKIEWLVHVLQMMPISLCFVSSDVSSIVQLCRLLPYSKLLRDG